MREYERLKAEAEASAAISSDASASVDKAAVSNSEVTSNSSAQDMGSESSFSDLPVSPKCSGLIFIGENALDSRACNLNTFTWPSLLFKTRFKMS